MSFIEKKDNKIIIIGLEIYILIIFRVSLDLEAQESSKGKMDSFQIRTRTEIQNLEPWTYSRFRRDFGKRNYLLNQRSAKIAGHQ